MIALFSMKAYGYIISVLLIVPFMVFIYLGNDMFASLKYTFAVFSLLQILLSIFWRGVWKITSKLSEWIFPDLNGSWDMTIDWQDMSNGRTGSVMGEAKIKHTLTKIILELKTEKSDSETLCVSPSKRESGTKELLYVYRNTARNVANTASQDQLGAVILKIDDSFNEMQGSYFTNKGTKGTVHLVKK